MKKFIALLCIFCLTFCFASCEKAENEPETSKQPVVTNQPTSKPTGTPSPTGTPNPTATIPTEKPTSGEAPTDITKLTNVALDKLTEENGHGYESEWWNKNFLTDGFKMEDDTDGQTNGWMSEYSQNIDDETWAYVDLEDTYTVQAVGVYPRESEKYFPVAYEIQLSMDAENWTTVHSVTMDYGYLDAEHIFPIKPAEAQYVRILVTERYDEIVGGNGYIAEITEIEVYA